MLDGLHTPTLLQLPRAEQIRQAEAYFGFQRPEEGFGMIVVDPPWHFKTRSAKGEGKSPQAHYKTMTIADIKAMPIHPMAATNAICILWATNPLLPKAFEVMDAWGFTFKTAGHWVKRTKHGKIGFGTGYILRCAGEPFLIGTKGRPTTTRKTRSVIEGPLREHSRKPDESYDMAEALFPGVQRLDLFSRETRPGWTDWGAETGHFNKLGLARGQATERAGQ